MSKPMTADDIYPLVAGLTPVERVRLIRLMTRQSEVDDSAVYGALPPRHDEFSTDEDSLAWEADDWEDID